MTETCSDEANAVTNLSERQSSNEETVAKGCRKLSRSGLGRD